jgi:hypothetical protein
MGYDLHITRKEYWADEDGPQITLDEWQAYVAQDPDIVPDGNNPGPENYVFAAHSERHPLWWHRSGEIYTKNPDDTMIAKLVQIARALHAKVLGDDDEVYGVDPSNPGAFERR